MALIRCLFYVNLLFINQIRLKRILLELIPYLWSKGSQPKLYVYENCLFIPDIYCCILYPEISKNLIDYSVIILLCSQDGVPNYLIPNLTE